MRDALLNDQGVSGLLLIHGLHPISLEVRLSEALTKSVLTWKATVATSS